MARLAYGRACRQLTTRCFTFLVSEATLNWIRTEDRPALGRIFDHGTMKNSSAAEASRLKKAMSGQALPDAERGVFAELCKVASAFVDAQQRRNEADYNTGHIWTRTEAVIEVEKVAAAFDSWRRIRTEPAAQAYLLSLLAKRRQ